MARHAETERLTVKGLPDELVKSNDHGSHWGMAALLAALGMVSPFSLDTFYPSFPAIAREFSITTFQLQQTITAYMVPFALMTLVQGPLSDALGRRPVVLAGLSIYSLASIACVLAPSFAALLVFRAVQGMSAGVGMAVGRAIIRDLHEGPQAQKLMSAITMIFSIAPAIAPVLGGWIHVLLGWRYVFGFMVVTGVSLVVLSYLLLPETHPFERRVRFDVPKLAHTLLRIATTREFMLLALALGVTFAAMITFIGAAPAIVLGHWHMGETSFAALFVPLICGILGGAWLSGRLAGRIPGGRQIAIGYALTLSGGLVTVLLHASLAEPPVFPQQLCITLIATGVQMMMPIYALRMLDLFPDARGSAASVQSCATLGIGAIFIGGFVPALSHSMLALGLESLLAAVAGFIIWRFVWPKGH
ncbi:MAG TPA: multidrug effflux MFS transporter [Steroidobacteraceae bacterium]|nr:multidrug effflux MFS transporter [Steroidobacteraceae bacterium]